MLRQFTLLLFLPCFFTVSAQQNLTMYTLPLNPQTNTLNPAFQSPCRLFIGLPVLSSMYFNYGNDAFSYRELFKQQNNEYAITENNLSYGRIYSTTAELYAPIINIGFWLKKKYLTFSVTDKSDVGIFYSRDLFSVLVGGNAAYDGQKAKLSPLNTIMDYRREYAAGISWSPDNIVTYGLKGKLLFGKLNLLSHATNSNLYTDLNTSRIILDLDFNAQASLPIVVNTDMAEEITSIDYSGDIQSILFNRRNLGLAFDAGFIKKISEQEIISGSVLDLGFIYYRSSPYKYDVTGSYKYSGNSVNSNTTFQNLSEILDTAFSYYDADLTSPNYYVFLPPRIYFNYQYQYSQRTNLNATFTARIFRSKINPALSLAATHQLFSSLYVALSWNYVNRTLKNIGTGIVIGRSPVQFYAFTDNVLGLIYPLSARNLNARFGINLIFGCKKKDNIKNCGCAWLNEAAEKEKRLKKLRK